MERQWTEQDFLSCCGSTRFAGEMAAGAPFTDLDAALRSAGDIWLNRVDVKGWLEALAAHRDRIDVQVEQGRATHGELGLARLFEGEDRASPLVGHTTSCQSTK